MERTRGGSRTDVRRETMWRTGTESSRGRNQANVILRKEADVLRKDIRGRTFEDDGGG